jgi:hypothetical protein
MRRKKRKTIATLALDMTLLVRQGLLAEGGGHEAKNCSRRCLVSRVRN